MLAEELLEASVAAQRYPAPRVLAFEEGTSLCGRPFMVMERLPGIALMG